MNIMAVISIFWILYGIAGLFGFQIIPAKFKGKVWTKNYIRGQGLSWVVLGIPWLILYCVIAKLEMVTLCILFLMLVCSIPSFAYSIALDRKYKAMLEEK